MTQRPTSDEITTILNHIETLIKDNAGIRIIENGLIKDICIGDINMHYTLAFNYIETVTFGFKNFVTVLKQDKRLTFDIDKFKHLYQLRRINSLIVNYTENIKNQKKLELNKQQALATDEFMKVLKS